MFISCELTFSYLNISSILGKVAKTHFYYKTININLQHDSFHVSEGQTSVITGSMLPARLYWLGCFM